MADPVFRIVNPSDDYTIVGDREAVCAVAALLGYGLYVVEDEKGEQVLPPFAFAGIQNPNALDDWWREKFSHDFGVALDLRRQEMAAACDSVLIGSFEDRRRMEAVLAAVSSPEEREKARAAWHDKTRTSMNDIGAAARKLAAQLRRPRNP